MKRNRYLIPLGALLAIFALGAVVMMVRASADDMLHQAARLLADTETGYAAGNVRLEMPEKDINADFKVWGRRHVGSEGEPAFHVELHKSDEAKPVIAVSDGFQVWISTWDGEENTVYVGTNEELKAKIAEHKGEFDHSDFDRPDFNEEELPQTPEEAVDRLLTYFTAERNGSDAVVGRDGIETAAEKLRLIPKPEEMPEEFRANGGMLYFWLRDGDNAPLAVEYTGGAVGYGKVTLTNLELGQDVSDDKFVFEIPAGAEVVRLADIEPPESLTEAEAEAAADFDVLLPAELPGAARLQSISEVRGAIVQRYRLPDGQSFTIAQGPDSAADAPGDNGELVTVRGAEGLLFVNDDGQRALLTWLENDTRHWIGGDLLVEQVLAIAESLQ